MIQAVASTKHGKDKFNIVHFLCNYMTLQYLIPTCCTMYIYSSDIFWSQFLAIFVELIVLVMCAVYISTYLVTVYIYD